MKESPLERDEGEPCGDFWDQSGHPSDQKIRAYGVLMLTFPPKSGPLRTRVFLRRLGKGELVMKRKRFTEEQIVGVLREHEAGC